MQKASLSLTQVTRCGWKGLTSRPPIQPLNSPLNAMDPSPSRKQYQLSLIASTSPLPGRFEMHSTPPSLPLTGRRTHTAPIMNDHPRSDRRRGGIRSRSDPRFQKAWQRKRPSVPSAMERIPRLRQPMGCQMRSLQDRKSVV